MIRQIIAITLKELKVLWLDREALALLFAMPMFFILVMSFALEGVFEAGSKGHPIEILVVHQDGGRLAEQAIADLKRMEGLILIETHEGIPLTSDKAEQLIGRGVYPLALLFTEGYTEQILKNANDPQKGKAIVYLISDPAMNLQLLATVKGAIQGAIERRVLLARIPQRLKEMFGTLGGTEGQLDNMLEDPNISERGRSGVDFIHTFPKGFNAGRRPTATEQNKDSPSHRETLTLLSCEPDSNCNDVLHRRRGVRDEARTSPSIGHRFLSFGGSGERFRTLGGGSG